MGSTASKPTDDERARMFRTRRVPFLTRLAVLLPWRTPLRRVSPRAPRVGMESMDSVHEMRAAMAAMGGWDEGVRAAPTPRERRRQRRAQAASDSGYHYSAPAHFRSHSYTYSSYSAQSTYSSAYTSSVCTAPTSPVSPPRSFRSRAKRPRAAPYRRSWGSYAADESDLSDNDGVGRRSLTPTHGDGAGHDTETEATWVGVSWCRKRVSVCASMAGGRVVSGNVGAYNDDDDDSDASDGATVWESAVETLGVVA